MSDRRFDLLVVGAGVFGAGVAREAALNGLSVALVDRGDLGGETSSRSSKMIHGGLRYLETFEFGLVKQALRERHVLQELAPHLVRPCPFLVPVHAGARRGLFKLRCGLFLYDWLAGFPREFGRKMLGREEMLAAEPRLEAAGLRGGGRYFDWQVFDSRLVAEIALQAREAGAKVLTYAEVAGLEGGPPGTFHATVRDVFPHGPGGAGEIEARAVVAATGPWSDAFRTAVAPGAAPRTRLTSGVHVVVPRVLDRHAVLVTARSDGRVLFLLPFHGRTLIGTTDRDYAGDPARLAVEAGDVDYLLAEANAVLGGTDLRREDVIQAFGGVRTLARDTAEHPSKTSREQVIWEEPKGCVHVIGGKLTTWRLIARELLERAAAAAGLRIDDGSRSRNTPLPGGCFGPGADPAGAAADLARSARVPEETAARALCWFGSRAPRVLDPARSDPRLAGPLAPSIPESAAEVLHLFREEGALTLVDALRRRLPRLLLDRVGRADLARAAAALGPALGWDAARQAAEVDAAVAVQARPGID